MRYFLSIAAGLAVVALIALVFPLLQSQELVQERRASAELEKVVANLKTELDTANKGGAQLKAKLDETNANIEQLRNELAAAKSQSTESQVHEQELTTELEKARKVADQQLAAERQASQSQIDALNKTAEEGKAKLSDADKQIADLQAQLATASAQLKQTNDGRNAAQSKLSETQFSTGGRKQRACKNQRSSGTSERKG